MKILYVCHGSLPSPHTDTEQILQTLAHLTRQGVDVDLIFPNPPRETRPLSERQGEIAAFYGLSSQTFGQGLRLLEFPLPGWLKGNVRRGGFALCAAHYSRGRGYDLVYTRDLFPLWACLMAGTPVVYETYRVDINTRRRFYPWRKICYTRPNLLGVVTHSRLAQQAFVRAGFDERRTLLAYNGFALQTMQPVLSREEARRRNDLPPHRKIVVYTGQVNPNKGLEVLLSIAAQLPEVLFLIVGGIPHLPQTQAFQRRIEADRLVNVRMVPRVPPAQVASYLYAADCLIIPPTAAPLYRYGRTVLPIKTFLYLAAGRPIVAPDLMDVREVLRDGHNALLTPPDAPQKSAAVIDALLRDGPLQERLARNARRDAQNYTWDCRATRIAAFLRQRVA